MSKANEKPWEKPWSTEEFIENAGNWSLAGDVAVLKTLEAFADVSTFYFTNYPLQ